MLGAFKGLTLELSRALGRRRLSEVLCSALVARNERTKMVTDEELQLVDRCAKDTLAVVRELLALRKDAERYRWLCANNFDKPGATQVHTWVQTWEPHSQTGDPTEWTQRIRGGALDRVIDEAMEAALAVGAA